MDPKEALEELGAERRKLGTEVMENPHFTEYECLRCGHRWYPRPGQDGVLRRPVQCAKCHSGLWDRAREVRT